MKKDNMSKTKQEILKEIEHGLITIEVIFYKGRSYNKRKQNAAMALVKEGKLQLVSTKSLSSEHQQSRGFGRLGGSYKSVSVISLFKKFDQQIKGK